MLEEALRSKSSPLILQMRDSRPRKKGVMRLRSVARTSRTVVFSHQHTDSLWSASEDTYVVKKQQQSEYTVMAESVGHFPSPSLGFINNI